MRHCDSAGRLMRFEPVEIAIDWTRVVAIRIDRASDLVVLVVDSGLEIKVQGPLKDVVHRWRAALGRAALGRQEEPHA